MKIERTKNGAVLFDEEGGKIVYKFNDFEDKNDWDEFVDMLYFVAYKMQEPSRYDKYRILIKTIHGDKYDCINKKICFICSKR